MGRNVVEVLKKTPPPNTMLSCTVALQSKDAGFLNKIKILMWQYLGLQRSQVGYDALRLEIDTLEDLYPQEEALIFLMKTALSHAQSMPHSCGSHHIVFSI